MSLQLGAPAIDQQHQALFVSFRKLMSAGQAQFPDEVLGDLLSQLDGQIRHHFATEEALMVEIELPEPLLNQHCAAHESILDELTQLHLDAMYGNEPRLPEVIATVVKWVQQHLVEFDVKLKPYIDRAAPAQINQHSLFD
jgi:hemerythrin-like metal-binding protein